MNSFSGSDVAPKSSSVCVLRTLFMNRFLILIMIVLVTLQSATLRIYKSQPNSVYLNLCFLIFIRWVACNTRSLGALVKLAGEGLAGTSARVFASRGL